MFAENIDFTDWLRKPFNQFVCLLSLLPALFIGVYIAQNAVSVPYSNQWGVS